jgi:hypothetical protein
MAFIDPLTDPTSDEYRRIDRDIAAAEAAEKVRAKLAETRAQGSPVLRGHVAFALADELTSIAHELQSRRAFEARVLAAAQTAVGWVQLREELVGGAK